MSQYTVSSSESSSFCTNPTAHGGPVHAESVVVSVSKRTRTRPSNGSAAHASDAAGDAADGVSTPTRPSQSSKAAPTHESPSMTIRRVPVDYSQRMEDQKARSSALERYKMLVRGNRLVDSGATSPNPVKARETTPAAASQTRGATASALRESVVSDDSDGEAAGPTRLSLPRRSAGTAPAATSTSPSSRRVRAPPSQQQQRRTASLESSPVSLSVSMDRPGNRRAEAPDLDSSPAPVVPQLNLANARPTVSPSQHVPRAATAPLDDDSETEEVGDDGEDDGAVAYVAPELTQPFRTSSARRRATVRPDYEPVTARDRPLLQASGGSQPRQSASATTRRTGRPAPGSNQSTPRRNSAPRNIPGQPSPRAALVTAPSQVSTVDEEHPAPPTSRGVVTELFPDHKGANAHGVAAAGGEEGEGLVASSRAGDAASAHSAAQQQQQRHQQRQQGVALAGSKAAFWLRPSTAMYEMTASIAAKRKDYNSEGSGSQRTSPMRRSARPHAAAATSSGTASSMGTPRGRPSTTGAAAGSAAAEDRPRFTTHLSATDRVRYEEVPAASPSASGTYADIFATRQSIQHMSASNRPSQHLPAAAATNGHPGPNLSAQPRAVPRIEAPRGLVERRPSTLSRLSSNPVVSTAASEERQQRGGGGEEGGRVSTRQQDSFAKHCARVAARAGPADEAAASAPPAAPVPAKKHKKVKKAPAAAAVAAAHADAEAEAEPVPRTTVPRSTGRLPGPTTPVAEREAEPEPSSPETALHGRRRSSDGSPSKSRRREHDHTASLPRPDELEARWAEQDAVMQREKEEARAQQARAVMESCRQARQTRATARATGAATSTNEVVAAMLQGIVQQTRQVLPCYCCADQQTTAAYRVHVELCRPKTEALLREHFTSVAGMPDGAPAPLLEQLQLTAALEVPTMTASEEVRDAYAAACYQCLKAMLVPCRKCGVHVRVHDVKEHEMLCGRAYYQNSRAAERVRSTAARIEQGAQEE